VIRLAQFSFLLTLTGFPLFAADIDGTWKGDTGANGIQTLTLKADGGKLTGNMSTAAGPLPIANGKVDGVKVTWVVYIEFNGTSISQNFSGILAGDELKMTVEGSRGGPREIIYKRSK
jgi:hypothetical protein